MIQLISFLAGICAGTIDGLAYETALLENYYLPGDLEARSRVSSSDD
jgi:hypothetical protein